MESEVNRLTQLYWVTSSALHGRLKQPYTVELCLQNTNRIQDELGPKRRLLKSTVNLEAAIIAGTKRKKKLAATATILPMERKHVQA